MIDLNKKEIGSRMRKKRIAKGWTQLEFAKKCGLSNNYYSSIENGKNSPSLDKLRVIADNLDVSLIYLLNDTIEDTENRVEKEIRRIGNLFEDIPSQSRELVQGLIVQAARLRILLDDNWKDILENGEYEKFSQSKDQEPYDRRRPISENYDNRDKSYQLIIKQLTELLPASKGKKTDNKSKLLGR
ncbi:helix-turn-helix domain-containing protein [Enterococcus sp. LJL128]